MSDVKQQIRGLLINRGDVPNLGDITAKVIDQIGGTDELARKIVGQAKRGKSQAAKSRALGWVLKMVEQAADADRASLATASDAELESVLQEMLSHAEAEARLAGGRCPTCGSERGGGGGGAPSLEYGGGI